jgi:biopolymer transport protein ExbB/TolQ
MKSKKKPIVLIVVGALLMLGPLWGMIGTVLSMLRTFTTLQQSGAADPEQLAAGIGASLWATVAGIIAAPFGIALLIAGIVWLVKMKQETNRSEPAVGTYGS